ncbi:MAG TPA: histone deacetylase family protein [Rhizomicrobium sp.]|jgi:acetoin utilization deacetylase AcuC-like enzyme|nr:histone deacetylase family protein [Rhizomicrobium sp.]
MKTFYSSAHLAHAPREEFEQGRLTPAVEIPERVERVKARIEDRKLGPVLAPAEFGAEPALRIHDPAFVQFLTDAYTDWRKAYWRDESDAIPSTWPARGLRERRGGDIESRLGSYCFDTATPITKGTWEAARAGVNVALSAAQAVRGGERAAFALARPPGHHASSDVFGGYCYLNNVAIAAQWLADQGIKPAILDVDYHHGNGTQSIFYKRNDVLFVSIHADPSFAYPHYLGFADERGEGIGEDVNLNLPLPKKTDWTAYSSALDAALARIAKFAPDVLLVSLGLDTFEGDPICRFKISTEDYLRMGERLAAMKLPTLFVFEGGYNIEKLGENTVNVLEGFEGR